MTMPQPKHGSRCSPCMRSTSPLEPESFTPSFLPSHAADWTYLTDATAHALPAAVVCYLKIITSLLLLSGAKRSALGPA
ncbi:hypothetical protein E2C01_053267 [Portunus trituberculatus]|uniref:Uncharacterized protein n=1 Tax=Portunus trituberculatus TaxID=210409 RepID=A0A5B7GFY3_PORTR|nr:hypothetical protein [Portunus trituberculatus]